VLPIGVPAHWESRRKKVFCLDCARRLRLIEVEPPEGGPPLPLDIGRAGGSSLAEYERRVAKRDRHAREVLGNRLGGVWMKVTAEPQSTRAWATGASGEAALAAALDRVAGIRVLHDRQAPRTRGNIDHLVVAPSGVYVIDTKNLRGLIQIRSRGSIFRPERRLYVGSRDRTSEVDGLGWQVDAVIEALARAGIDPTPDVIPVLCFIDGEWPLLRAPNEFHGVRLESVRTLLKALSQPGPLELTEVDKVSRALARALPSKG